MKKFALIGAAGYIAPRHMQAIKDTGNVLVAALDTHDSAGIIDNYFPNADFFTEFERFDRHIDKCFRSGNGIDYVSVCSPNYLHDSHIRFALRSGADAICEKPVTINHWNIDGLIDVEKQTGKKVYSILQLRHHPAVISLLEQVNTDNSSGKYEVDVTYITSRGKWYFYSWKGDEEKSGGIEVNIGIHFFDMLQYVFGRMQHTQLHFRNGYKSSGFTEYEKARVRWFLSVDINDVPQSLRAEGKQTLRSLKVNGNEIDFSDGFVNLHTKVYQSILAGMGTGLEESRPSVEAAGIIRSQTPATIKGDYHPLLNFVSR